MEKLTWNVIYANEDDAFANIFTLDKKFEDKCQELVKEIQSSTKPAPEIKKYVMEQIKKFSDECYDKPEYETKIFCNTYEKTPKKLKITQQIDANLDIISSYIVHQSKNTPYSQIDPVRKTLVWNVYDKRYGCGPIEDEIECINIFDNVWAKSDYIKKKKMEYSRNLLTKDKKECQDIFVKEWENEIIYHCWAKYEREIFPVCNNRYVHVDPWKQIEVNREVFRDYVKNRIDTAFRPIPRVTQSR